MKNILKSIKNKIDGLPSIPSWVLFVGWVLFGLIILYVRLPHMSPANPLYYGTDESVFYAVSANWLEGLLPYRDLFDHKGPILYIFYVLGLLLHPGKVGVFVLLSVSYGASLYYLYRMARLFVERYAALLVIIGYICVSLLALTGTGEQVCLPFIAAPLYYLMRHLHQTGSCSRISNVIWLGTGICFGVIMLVKPTIVATLGVLVGFILIKLAKEKQIKELVRVICMCVLGFLLPMIPVFCYFYTEGILYDFMYGAYIFNFSYAGKGFSDKGVIFWLTIVKYTASLWIILIFGGMLYRRALLPGVSYAAMSIVALLSASACVPGYACLQYFIPYSPCVVFALVCVILCVKNIGGKKIAVAAAVSCLLAYGLMLFDGLVVMRWGLYGAFLPEHHARHRAEWNVYRECQAMSACIPESELSSVLFYNGQGNVYLYMHAKPPVRYFMLQDWLMVNMPSMRQELESSIISAKPKWVIVRRSQYSDVDNKPLVTYIEEQCESVKFQTGPTEFLLFSRKK